MKTIVFLILAAVVSLANAASYKEIVIAKRSAEKAVKNYVNDPDSVKFDSMTIYKNDNRFVTCGMLRGRNGFGGMVRQTYVVDKESVIPVYVGNVPLDVFKKDCSGEVIYRK